MMSSIAQRGLGMLFAGIALLSALDARADPSYPVTITDMAGHVVTIDREPKRLFLQDGTDLLLLSVLDRANPFARLVGWTGNLAGSDPALWQLFREKWPEADDAAMITFDNGEIDREALINAAPDVIVLQAGIKPLVSSGDIDAVLKSTAAKIVYIDTELDPFGGVEKSMRMLGQILDRQQEADAFIADYRRRLQSIDSRLTDLAKGPRVFIDIRAGEGGLDDCCRGQGDVAWGLFVKRLKADNLASSFLNAPAGQISVETLIAEDPDFYILTGTQRVRQGALTVPFGYGADASAVSERMASVSNRSSLPVLSSIREGRVTGIYHQFYKHAFNVIGLEYLAKAIYPGRFEDVDPDADYRDMIAHFTDLPARPFIFTAPREESKP